MSTDIGQVGVLSAAQAAERMAKSLERGQRLRRAVLLFAVYPAEGARTEATDRLEERLRAQGFEISRIYFPYAGDIDWPASFAYTPPEANQVFFVYNISGGFPTLLDQLNYRREFFAERRVRAVFWITEDELAALAEYAPDFFRFRTEVIELRPLLSQYAGRPVEVTRQDSALLHSVPPPPADFVGREDEIAALQAELAGADRGARAVIGGLGGIGKTALACAVAARLRGRFPDAQILLSLRGGTASPLSPEDAVSTVIHAFAPTAVLPANLAGLQPLYQATLQGKRVLILADDAAGPAQARPLLPPPGCALLVTTRADFRLPGSRLHALDALPPSDSVALAQRIAPRLTAAEAAALAGLCGYVPLALRAAAGLLDADRARPVAAYLTALASERNRLAALRSPDDPSLDVDANLVLSWEALPAFVQAVLAQFSVFPASFEEAAARAVVQGSTAALGTLRRRDLLEYDEAPARYGLHEFVRAFAAAHLAASPADAARWRHARHYVTVARQAQDLYLDGGDAALAGLARFDRERAHIDAGWAWTQAQARTAEGDQLLLMYAEATAYIGELRYDKRRERIPQLEAALAAARRLGNRKAEASLLGKLGQAYKELGEAQRAIDYQEQDLQIARELGDRGTVGAMLGSLGTAYAALGDARRAIAYYDQHLVIARAIGDRRGEGYALGNLGNAHVALGQPGRALEYFEKSLAIAREAGDRRREGLVLGNLGVAHASLGEQRRAIEEFEQSLEIARQIGDLFNQAQLLGNLGKAYADLGDLQRAIEYYTQHLAQARALGDRSGEARTLTNMGRAYSALGEPRRAVTYIEQALETSRAIGDRRGEVSALSSLAIAYDRAGQGERAIQYFEQALEIARSTGDRHAEATINWNLGLRLAAEGDMERSSALMQILVDFERASGHPDAERSAAQLEQIRKQLPVVS